jgi:hypothetical protein
MTVVYAPNVLTTEQHFMKKVFLAGSIDMGNASQWQAHVIAEVDTKDVLLMNPRRPDWDSSWEQDIKNDMFREQVQWELDHLALADLIFFYFDPNGPAPITLMELGMHVEHASRLVVVCPIGYWRRGNLQIVCARYNIELIDTLDEGIEALKAKLIEPA